MSSEEKPAVADEVLAYGLAWQENRDLHLALPGPMVATTLTRLPWIETKVRVWVMEGERPQQVRTLSRMDVLDRLRELPPRVSRRATLPADAEPWIAALETSGLEAHNRSSTRTPFRDRSRMTGCSQRCRPRRPGRDQQRGGSSGGSRR